MKLRIGAVGCGGQASRNIHPALSMIPEIDFVAVCDLDEERARHNARQFGANQWFSSAKEMFEKAQLDATVIVGPPPMHTEVGLEAASAGLHVFTEKPVGITPEAALCLVETIDSAGVYGQVGHMSRHADAVRIAYATVQQSLFGDVTFVESKYYTPGPNEAISEIPTPIRTFNLYHTTHELYLARSFGGDVVSLHALRADAVGNAVALAISLEFSNGAVGWVNVNSCVPSMECRLEVTGSGRALVAIDNLTDLRYEAPEAWHDGPTGYQAIAASTWRPTPLTTSQSRTGYGNQLEHFASSILAGKKPSPSIRDGYEAVRLCFSIEDSLALGHPVNL